MELSDETPKKESALIEKYDKAELEHRIAKLEKEVTFLGNILALAFLIVSYFTVKSMIESGEFERLFRSEP